MTTQTEAALLEAITQCAARQMGPYGPCYCREPYPNREAGHEELCKTLARAVKASIAALATPASAHEAQDG